MRKTHWLRAFCRALWLCLGCQSATAGIYLLISRRWFFRRGSQRRRAAALKARVLNVWWRGCCRGTNRPWTQHPCQAPRPTVTGVAPVVRGAPQRCDVWQVSYHHLRSRARPIVRCRIHYMRLRRCRLPYRRAHNWPRPAERRRARTDGFARGGHWGGGIGGQYKQGSRHQPAPLLWFCVEPQSAGQISPCRLSWLWMSPWTPQPSWERLSLSSF